MCSGVWDDLQRERHVRSARHPRHETLDRRVELQPILAIRVALLERPFLIGDRAALDDSETARNRAQRAHLDDGTGLGGVALNVPVGRSYCLPNPVQIGIPVRCEWCLIFLRRSGCRYQGQGERNERANGRGRRVQCLSHQVKLQRESTTLLGIMCESAERDLRLFLTLSIARCHAHRRAGLRCRASGVSHSQRFASSNQY